ncbi:hypothetical protein EER27_04695 [Lysobacter psychrotolerans]|uniref:Molecular chaperone GroEL n=1 Tax=Montanilutibacter psychrotolerans TaxID=1327343 RepID=A0A3M8SVW1_9GAMM|nr:hypothetical protein EER27_04695 [Lysobacter psychrotolerans]
MMGVSIIHTLFAIAVFKDVLASIVSRGVFNTVGADPLTGVVVWFVLFGIVLFVCGMATSALERATGGHLPKSLGWGLLGLVIVGVVLMPASGFWLAIPPTIAILARKRQPALAAA